MSIEGTDKKPTVQAFAIILWKNFLRFLCFTIVGVSGCIIDLTQQYHRLDTTVSPA